MKDGSFMFFSFNFFLLNQMLSKLENGKSLFAHHRMNV